MAKSNKKRWLKTMRAQRYFRLVSMGGRSWRPTFRRVEILEAEFNTLAIAASKVKLLNGAHNTIFQYHAGAKPLLYSYTSGCRCHRCTPKEWAWHTWSDGRKSLQSFPMERAA